MPACHAGDRRFESGRVRHYFPNTTWLDSSVTSGSSLKDQRVVPTQQTAVALTCRERDRGPTDFVFKLHGSIAQSVEQRTENPRVGGSIPSRATMLLA